MHLQINIIKFDIELLYTIEEKKMIDKIKIVIIYLL